jgi:hypothetical protein
MAYTTDDRRDSRAVDTMFDAYFYNGLGMKARVSLRTEGYGSVATITLGPHNDSTSSDSTTRPSLYILTVTLPNVLELELWLIRLITETSTDAVSYFGLIPPLDRLPNYLIISAATLRCEQTLQ